MLFLNSHVSGDDIPDGAGHTIFVGEKIVTADDLGWMSGTRATLRNTGHRINTARPIAAMRGRSRRPGRRLRERA